MLRISILVVLLVLGLGGLTWGASVLVHQQTRAWFEKDLNLRAQLAVNGARTELVASWRQDPDRLERQLEALTKDERILGACACTPEGEVVARTDGFPTAVDFPAVMKRVAREGPNPEWGHWSSVETLTQDSVHLAALPLADERGPLGYVVLAHDLAFIQRREAKLQQFLIAAFGVLAVCASVLTFAISRMSWHAWSEELRRVLRFGSQRKEYQPLMSDVRALVDRLMDQEGRAWTPQRLKETLRHQLNGERIVVLANREPYVHQRTASGEIEVMHPASGLVTALEPVVRACSGTWIAHGSGSADRETSDRHGRLRVPTPKPGDGSVTAADESYELRRVWLTEEEERGYYYGFSNEGLWPLCHIAHTRPTFRSEDWDQYRAVNEKFVKAVLEQVDTDDPIVLVQDYHFALAPALLRKALPRATVIMFWHIPWPNPEQFGICPYREELLKGMLGASILGFHTQFHCNNFRDSVDRYLEARIDRDRNAVIHEGHTTLVNPYPISVAWPMPQLEGIPEVAACREEVFRELKLDPKMRIGVGIDRLDYTKGIEERLLAIERLLERRPELVGHFTFIELAAPSRTKIERYRLLNEAVEKLAERINIRFSTERWKPILLLRAHHEPSKVLRYLRAADLCYVSSLHDGMNLVAKEFIAARNDERGVLVLSQFTGAAHELTEALIVNPYSLDEAADALATALDMPAEEQGARMRSMRMYIAEFNVYWWAGNMLIDAARLRRRERLIGSNNEVSLRTEASLR